MDGENLRLSMAQLYGIAGITAFIDVQGGQCADFYRVVARQDIQLVVNIRSSQV